VPTRNLAPPAAGLAEPVERDGAARRGRYRSERPDEILHAGDRRRGADAERDRPWADRGRGPRIGRTLVPWGAPRRLLVLTVALIQGGQRGQC
jgi:hypothetical protein